MTTEPDLRDSAPAPARPRRGRPGHDQEHVIRVAIRLFTEHGYEATSVGMLAKELSISKSAIYHHVPSKEQLLEVALDRALALLEQVLARDDVRSGPPDRRLEAALRGTTVALVENLEVVTLLLRLRGNTPLERQAMHRRRAFDETIAGIVQEAADAGLIRSDLEPLTVTRLAFGMINSITGWYQADGTVGADALADAVVAMVLDGIRS